MDLICHRDIETLADGYKKRSFYLGVCWRHKFNRKIMVSVWKKALLGWTSIVNYELNWLGIIWFCSSDKVVFTKLHISSQVIITCEFQILETNEQFICSEVYASNYEV